MCKYCKAVKQAEQRMIRVTRLLSETCLDLTSETNIRVQCVIQASQALDVARKELQCEYGVHHNV